MNSKRKFRVWDKVNKQFLPEDDIGIDNLGNVYIFDEDLGEPKDGHATWRAILLTDSDLYKVMYGTGLQDQTGKEIWEHDLIRMDGWLPEIYMIAFREGGFCGCLGPDGRSAFDINMIEDSKGIHATVIGNIYEQPELLKV